MSKIQQSRFKRSRSLGVSLHGEAKDAYNFKNYKPGQHGQDVHRKISTYSIQLAEKQKLRFVYDIREEQFRKIFIKSSRQRGDTSNNLIAALEYRLDAVVYRANFASTFGKVKQMISHKHVMVNGKTVNIRSYVLRDGDIVSVSPKAKDLDYVKASLASSDRKIPDYLQTVSPTEIKVVRRPAFSEVPYAFVVDPQLVVEWYSNKIG